MKTFSKIALPVAAAAVGLSIGFTWRGKSNNDSLTVQHKDGAPVTGVVSVASLSQPIEKPEPILSPEDTFDQLERDLSMSSGVTRWLYWLEAIEKAQPQDFPKLARLAKGNSAALRFIAARWVEVDARHLFDTLVAAPAGGGSLPTAELADVLFKEWPRRDPAAAIAALNETDHLPGIRGFRLRVAMSVIEKDPERGLGLMSAWNFENIGPSTRTIAKWAAQDPRHAAQFTLQTPAGFASELSMQTIGKEWAKLDPGAALNFAVANPGELGSTLAKSVLKEWAERNIDEAADWLAATDEASRRRLSKPFLEIMAKEDLDGALAWSVENLSGSSLEYAIGGMLKGAAQTDVHEAAGLVNDLTPSPIRIEAAVAVAREWFPQGLTWDKAVPPEAVKWLSQLDSESIDRVMKEVQWGWAHSNPESMAEFLVSAAGKNVSSRTDTILAREMARHKPSDAIDWADRLPENRRLNAGGVAFETWRVSQPETAMEWLHNLPSTDPRQEAYFRQVVRSLVHHPQAADQLATMSAPDRAAARNIIESLNLSESQRARLLGAVPPK